jgi:hypothetical protein
LKFGSRILPVEPHDDQPVDLRDGRLLAEHRPPEHAEGPDEQRQDGDQDRRGEHEERRQQGEPGARAYIGLGDARNAEQERKRKDHRPGPGHGLPQGAHTKSFVVGRSGDRAPACYGISASHTILHPAVLIENVQL